MFEKIYLSVDSKVVPNEELLEKTKEKMKLEMENAKTKDNINFYKYVTMAACIVLFIGVIGIVPKNVGTDSLTEGISNNTVMQDVIIFKDSNFTGLTDINSFDKQVVVGEIEIAEKETIIDKIGGIIISIIQWFHKLLF